MCSCACAWVRFEELQGYSGKEWDATILMSLCLHFKCGGGRRRGTERAQEGQMEHKGEAACMKNLPPCERASGAEGSFRTLKGARSPLLLSPFPKGARSLPLRPFPKLSLLCALQGTSPNRGGTVQSALCLSLPQRGEYGCHQAGKPEDTYRSCCNECSVS